MQYNIFFYSMESQNRTIRLLSCFKVLLIGYKINDRTTLHSAL